MPFLSGYRSGILAFLSLGQLLVFSTRCFTVLGEGHSKQQEQLAYVVFFAAVPLLSLTAWVATRRLAASPLVSRFRPWFWMPVLTVAPALALALGLVNIQRVIYYSYDPIPRIPPFSGLRFAAGALIGALFFAGFLLTALRPVRLRSPRLVTAICTTFGGVLLLGLFDPYLMIDTLSYSPYVGPAFAMRNGAIPLLDTFSQYGPNFLVFAVAFSFAQTLYMASAIIAILNTAMAIAFVYIATKLGLNRFFSFAASIFVVWFVHAAFLYNESYTPSVFAMRFLPPVLLVASLVRMPADRSITLASAAAVLLCTLWSFEAFLWGFLIYLAWLVVRGVGERRPIARTVRDVVGVLLLVLGPHAVFMLIYLAMFHSPPRYDIYFELVFVHLAGNYWLMLVEAGMRAWILFGFVYGSALAYVGYTGVGGICGYAQTRWHRGARRPRRFAILLLCWPFSDAASSFHFAADDDAGADGMRLGHRRLGNAGRFGLADPRRAGAGGGVGLVRLHGRGVCRSDVRADQPRPPNRDVVSRLLARRRSQLVQCPAHAWPDQGGRCRQRRLSADKSGGSLSYTHSENKAEFTLVQRYAGQPGRRVLLFGTDPVPVIFHSPKDVVSQIVYPPHAIGVVYPSVDGLSPTLSARAIASLDGLQAGDIVIRGNLPIYDLDQKALQVIESRSTVCARRARDSNRIRTRDARPRNL